MITLLFEDDFLLKETSFSSDLVYYTNLKLLKRKNKDICLDVKLQNPDLLFTGLSTCAESFLDKVKSFRATDKNVKIVLLVDFCCEHIFWIAEKLEIDGIIKKDIGFDAFAEKVISIMNVSNDSCITDEPLINFVQLENILTNSEKEVFKLIGNGLTTKEISYSLNLSCRTIDKHRENILKKLSCKTAAILIFAATVYNLFLLF